MRPLTPRDLASYAVLLFAVVGIVAAGVFMGVAR